ncbi:hypothetical protein, partial [Escherichia coli]|uniref:hypothetical protein n=1 Tax=Escherichia coli TaxID=562 RepID=UPI0032DB40C0
PSRDGVQKITVELMAAMYKQMQKAKRARVEQGHHDQEIPAEEEDEDEPVADAPAAAPRRLNFEKQVLAQLGAMQLQMGQISQQVGLVQTEQHMINTGVQTLNTRVDHLEGAVTRIEDYQAWHRSHFPPSGPPYFPYDPSAGPSH